MIEPSGQVKVMDFGIAKLDEGANLTSTGAIMGTPNYMAPEQARGQVVDARADLFSLGCVLYECLSGTRPFQSPSVSGILVKILTEDPPPVDVAALGLPVGLEGVVRLSTAKEPSARYASGAAMIAGLRALEAPTTSSGAGVATPRCRRPVPAPLSSRRLQGAGEAPTSSHARPSGAVWSRLWSGSGWPCVHPTRCPATPWWPRRTSEPSAASSGGSRGSS
jgi:serine/threonine-protein kinase